MKNPKLAKEIQKMLQTPLMQEAICENLLLEAAKELRKLRNDLLLLDSDYDVTIVNKLIPKLKKYGSSK